jgi:hypothetical protein
MDSLMDLISGSAGVGESGDGNGGKLKVEGGEEKKTGGEGKEAKKK